MRTFATFSLKRLMVMSFNDPFSAFPYVNGARIHWHVCPRSGPVLCGPKGGLAGVGRGNEAD